MTSFSPYAKDYLPLILEKFREKKDKLNKEIINTLTSLLKCNITLDEVIGIFNNINLDKSNQFKLNVTEFLYILLGKTFKNVIRKCSRDLISLFVKLTKGKCGGMGLMKRLNNKKLFVELVSFALEI